MHSNDRIDGSHAELFPKNFGERLARLVELSGLSWEEFAERLGVACDRVTEWRGGEVPTGGEVWHIMRLAVSVPGGTELMLSRNRGSDDGERGMTRAKPRRGGRKRRETCETKGREAQAAGRSGRISKPSLRCG